MPSSAASSWGDVLGDPKEPGCPVAAGGSSSGTSHAATWTCKECHGNEFTPNPIIGARMKFLMQAAGKQRCNVCHAYINSELRYQGRPKTPEEFKKGREGYVQKRNGQAEPQTSSGPGPSSSPDDPVGNDTVVSRQKRAYTEVKEKLGTGWPVEKWCAHFGFEAVPPEKMTRKLRRGNRVVEYVVEDPAKGWVLGCVEVNDVWEDGAEMVSEGAADGVTIFSCRPRGPALPFPEGLR